MYVEDTLPNYDEEGGSEVCKTLEFGYLLCSNGIMKPFSSIIAGEEVLKFARI